jgi:hypothetical protein
MGRLKPEGARCPPLEPNGQDCLCMPAPGSDEPPVRYTPPLFAFFFVTFVPSW